ncbi:zinc finger protein REH1 [Kluyveromyces marxianus]|uniref:Zinc finger protein REH1 n=2 Tax=Kluyveromyces marxianus TaxID=4911 RepID=W0TFU4_KLUMD|nr:zinc finger protein REH1 [Kluyveromyces marxianus DMKU3-1042]QGN18057.1 zinc finger protein REH1 [Kluyveromyces marxianus]BAO41918.1 zinc finger protein REH1 [Kluyveromyces marxianus DMKU3-1042]BAP73342.1 zinc finger protein REH1 [Kluyveromyces marxianus]
MSDTVMFTCNSCMIQFQSSDLQRHHMKTEWHRYNLKRRVAELPPISASLFAEKLQLSRREQERNQIDEFGFPLLKPVINSSGYKKKGRRLGRSKLNTLDDPYLQNRSQSPASSITSRVSRATFRSTDLEEDDFLLEHGFTTEDTASHYSDSDYTSDSETESIHTDPESFNPKECIYCGKISRELEMNVKHMFSKHGLYIPERSYLVDLEGLLKYLADIIIQNNECLCCSYQGSSIESIRAHMDAKRHCMLPYESKAERALVAQFYDFSSLENAEPATSENVEDIISDSEESKSNDRDDSINSNYALVRVDDSGVELQLDNGIKVGHRSMRRYYRQNTPLGNDIPDDRKTVVAADRRVSSLLASRHMTKAVKQMKQLEKQHADKALHLRIKNSNNQKHFRDELLQ